ncbi:hypothetical protein [Halocalculus aciditolerans]|uniref:Uncharacterized protein n=1 Tax=Halocalculus aciditolerans TaxID=1383812 RepID=A0A830F757_9EURY|nr:hypothetical protein [Halocalculus aciditolerans]GGL45920.1 hypothetical protein GCM10009039_00310 [Halocalculus aciditolerans]
MGDFADDVHRDLRDALAARLPSRKWRTERYVERTPVDVATDDDAGRASRVAPSGRSHSPVPRFSLAPAALAPNRVILVEVEMRRADPANNPVKLARYADEGAFDAPVHLVQVFSGYYDLAGGGVSTKRENAEFVGRLATDALDGFTYDAVDLGFTPPKRGGDRPSDWRARVHETADRIVDSVERD